jgi:hypothetical protein
MYAIVVRESGDRDKIEASGDEITSNVAPRVRESPGFVSALWMTDGSGGTLNVLVFESEETAMTGLERARTAPRPPYMELESAEFYRVRAKA